HRVVVILVLAKVVPVLEPSGPQVRRADPLRPGELRRQPFAATAVDLDGGAAFAVRRQIAAVVRVPIVGAAPLQTDAGKRAVVSEIDVPAGVAGPRAGIADHRAERARWHRLSARCGDALKTPRAASHGARESPRSILVGAVGDSRARLAVVKGKMQHRRAVAVERGRAERNVGSAVEQDRKSTRLNSSHLVISYAVFCLKKKI